MKLTPAEKWALEAVIASVGLTAVLAAIVEICATKRAKDAPIDALAWEEHEVRATLERARYD